MRSARILVAASVLVIAACSSGGDDTSPASSAAPATEVDVAAPSTEAVEPEETPPSTEATDDEATDDEATTVTEPAAEVDGAGGSDESEEPADTEAPLVIDGPAEVRPSCASLTRGVSEFTLDAGGAAHDVRIYVPDTISADPAPTVLNWHGLGSSGPEQAAFTGYETLSETEGFIVVHATGLAGADGGGNSWELTQFDTDERDDLAFADALIDTVVADWCGDPARIYSTGMSNGGLFTSELVCNRSTRIAAAASIAGTTHAPTCTPERAVPYIAFHGTADDVVPFDGDEPSTLLPAAGVDALIDETTPAEFAEFAADAGCVLEPTRVEETDEVIRYDYAGCDDGVPMAFYEIVGGGHTWPSSPLSDALADFGFFTQDIDATVDAWAFMSQHTL
jgi:polyhydroxybutyrate depolymerase